MEWITCIRRAIAYMEDNLQNDITAKDIAAEVYVSPFFLQRGFSLMTGYGIGEYLRSRRLYEAALELRDTDARVIDIAMKYAYDTPESFAKAFSRFHGASPSQIRSGQAPVRTFLPLTINIIIRGGNTMEHRITQMPAFTVIGFKREFAFDTAYTEIPRFWDEIRQEYFDVINAGETPSDPVGRAVVDNRIGEYGVCIDTGEGDRFAYLIAGRYTGGEVPAGFTLYEFPAGEWAVFDCTGAMPDALQSVNTRVFREWLPGNPDYEIAGCANIEWYDCAGDMSAPDYRSAIWVPVKPRT